MNRNLVRKFAGVLFLGLLAFNVFSFINLGQGANPLTLKWTRNLGGLAKTYIAPLSVDLTGDGKMEVVVVGGSVDYGSDGTVTALDGATGNIIWQVAPGGIGMHTPFEIADINKDGIQEIVISGKSGAFVLHGNDGSLYWRNTNAPAEENYPAIADINGDGYYEIFVCRGYGPYNGYDWITSLTYDGQIIKQAWNWHPCWGGMTIGDTNFDGIMELFQGDRSYSYNVDTDPYKYGGMGLRALDALTLTPLWNDSDILSSSHAPMLGDVDNDGKLDVIAAYQSNGVVVLNATDGTVLNTGGKYRKSANTGMPSHSQPTILDLDGDGHLEFMDCWNSNPVIFDLYDWKIDATLPVRCIEPPKVGDVTGDGVGDIIAVTGYSSVTTIFSYDPVSKQYVSVQNVTGLLNANAFTLIQDIDGDGLNELVLTSSTGNVYCYDTLGIAPTPRARTGFQFFSERKLGVAEYIPPPGPLAPQISDPAPSNGATNVPVTTSQLAFTLKDFQSNPISFNVTTNPNVGIGNGTNVPNGRYSVPVTSLHFGTSYSWTVTATDGQHTNSKTYSFTTEAPPPWWNTNWPYRRKITINATRINGDQTNFPLLIDITSSGFTAKAQSNGFDFVFTDSGQIKLNHEIESYSNSSGHLIAWVKIPLLSSSQDTILYLYYGNPLASNQQNPASVWDQNYMMVQHLDEKTGLHFDSTINANNGTPLNGVLQGIAGKIDGADGFDGVNDYVEVPHSDTLAGYSQGFTISLWLRFDDVSRRQTILNKFNQSSATQRSWFIEFSPTNGLGLFASANGADYSEWHTPTFKPTVGTWYYVTLVWVTNSIPTFYVNGQQLTATGTARILQIYNNIGIPLAIGKSTYIQGREFKGAIDEARLSNIARATGWMLTSYGVERDPTSIYLLGTEEIFAAPQGPVLTSPSPVDGAIGVDLNPTLAITVNDFPAQPMNVTFSTNVTGLWQQLGTYTNVGNGIYTQSVSNLNDYNTKYYWRVNATDGSYSANGTYSFTTRPLLSNWWNTGWQYRRTITISHTKVQVNQNNFPFLVDLTDSAIAAKAQSSGNDLVFVDSNGVKLDHEIESYTSGNGHLTAWVRIPFLSASQDTVLYLYYGNPLASNQQNPSAVWDSDFKMVQHLEENGATRNDSTSNGRNAAANGGVTKASPGKIDGADVFDGTSGNLRQADITLFDQSQIFIESWTYVNSVPAAARFAKTHMYGRTLPSPFWWYGMWMGVPSSSPLTSFTMTIRLYNPNGAGSILSYSYTVSLVDQWVHVAMGLSKLTNRTYFYVNGALVKSDDITSALGSGYMTPLDDSLVKGFSVGSNIVGGEFLKMMSDELRISDIIRSTSWTLMSYNEQKDPSTFYSLGIEESLPSEPIVTDPSPTNGATGVPVSTTSLGFNLTDYQNDRLTYSVTTSPDVGSGSQPNVLNGRYTVAVHNLTYATTYSWTVNVTDGVHRTIRAFTFTTELSAPLPPANDIVFDSSFDMGNLRNVQFQSADAFGNRFYTAEQNHTTVSFADKHWWFYFSMDNVTGKTVTIKLVNNEAIDFTGNRWPEIEPVYSFDNINWERLPLSNVVVDNTAYTFQMTVPSALTFGHSKIWLAPIPPYNIAKRDALIAEFQSSPYLTVSSLGTTPGGQELKVLTITDPAYSDVGKFKSYVQAQQHAGEIPGSWNAEGLIRFLLSNDPTAVVIRRSYIFRIVPIVNVDGVYQGVSRYTPLRNGVQYDLNRWWSYDVGSMPFEVAAVFTDIQNFQPDSFNDFHSTINTEVTSPKEALTYSWTTTDPTVVAFRAKIKLGGYPETVTGITGSSYCAPQIHTRLGVVPSVSWENPHDELSTNPGVKLTVNDWMSWGAGWAKGNYLYFGNASGTLTTATVGSGTVSKVPNQATYDYGTNVQVTATPAGGWVFSGWSGDLIGTANPATVVINGTLSVTAHFVPAGGNAPPIISVPQPADGTVGVPLSTLSLNFTISDFDGDLMNYSVSTLPGIGTGSATAKPDGTYSIPISGLAYSTTYTWKVSVTDGKDWTNTTFTFTTEALSYDDVIFNSSFDMGNLKNVQFVSGDASGNRLYAAEQNHNTTTYAWWFYFSMENVAGKTVKVRIQNLNPNDFTGNRWPEIEPVYSYDGVTWSRVPLSGVFSDSINYKWEVTVTVPSAQNKIWLAPLPPYNIHLRDALFAEFASSPYLTVSSLGTMPGGQQLKVATITDPAYSDANKIKAYVQAQQHAGEVPGSWEADGMIRFLLSNDTTAQAIRRSYIFRIIPIVNVDGVYQGVSRYTPPRSGTPYDLNRDWSTQSQPEIQAILADMQAFQPLTFNDMHSTINTEMGSPEDAVTYTWYGGTNDPTMVIFLNHIRDAGWPDTQRGATGSTYCASIVHQQIGVLRSISWENPMDEFITNPGHKLTIEDWRNLGKVYATGVYLDGGDAQGTLAISVVGSGTVAKSPDQTTYAYGTSVQVTANPANGFTFTGWSGDLSGTTNPAYVTITGGNTVTATFTAIGQYTLTVNKDGNGQVNLDKTGPYLPNTIVQLTAVADPGWSFTAWSGDLTGSENPKSITMDGNKVVTATFTRNKYTLTIATNGNGHVDLTPLGGLYDYGTVVQLSAVQDSGWNFSQWSGDASGSTNPTSVTMDADKSVTATFTRVLQIYLPFSDNTVPIPDTSGNGNVATPYNGVAWQSTYGGVYNFDGTNDYMTVADSPSLDGRGTWTQLTVEFWVRPDSAAPSAQRILRKGPSSGTGVNSYQVGFQTTGSYLYFDVFAPASAANAYYEVQYNTALSAATWYHVVCVYKAGVGSKIYVNGVDVGATRVGTTGDPTKNVGGSVLQPLYIGCRYNNATPGPNQFFDGLIDDVQIYSVALSSGVVQQHYDATKTEHADYALSVSVPNGGGTVAKSPDQASYPYGTSVSLTPTNDTGYVFDHWEINGVPVGSDNPYLVTIDSNKAVTAFFRLE